MRSLSRVLIAAILAAALLTPLFWSRPLPAGSRPSGMRGMRPPPPRTPSQKSLREAMRCWHQAQDAVNAQLDALQAWDPAAMDALSSRQMRQELLAADPGSLLSRARGASREAWATAQTGEERCRAAGLLARIEHDIGDHETELLYARAMAEHEPRAWVTLIVLRRAAGCNGDKALEQRALRQLRVRARECGYSDPSE
jgi:hypothetical protein